MCLGWYTFSIMAEDDQYEAEFAPKSAGRSGHKFKVLYVIITLLLVLLSGGGVYMWQHSQLKKLNNQKASLSISYSSLSKKETDLNAKNVNLSKALQQLQQVQNQSTTSNPQQSDTANSNSDTQPQSAPAGHMTVTAVKNEPLTDFNAPNEPALASGIDVTAVYVTITNETSSIQSYNVFQFYATTSSGVVVDPGVYPGPYGAAIWNNSQLAPNGTQNIVLLFSNDNTYPTLSWTPPGGTSIVSDSLPSPATD